MKKVLDKYGIETDFSVDQKLAALEKEKLKVLRKLNHVFGNPEKEKALEAELEALENVMAELEDDGGKLSLDDVMIESRGLPQNRIEPDNSAKEDDEKSIRKKERLIKAEDTEHEDKVTALFYVILYYLKKQEFVQYEYWLLYGAKMGIGYFIHSLYEFYASDVAGEPDEKRAIYWLKQGAALGYKDSCEKLGQILANPDSDLYDPAKAVVCFVKAADAEHPNSYIYAFHMFHLLGEYKKAETCLKAAVQMKIKGAAHCMGAIYHSGKNSSGEKDMQLAQYWYEKEYQDYPDGNVCSDLGTIYYMNGEKEKGIEVLRRGVKEFHSEECRKILAETV